MSVIPSYPSAADLTEDDLLLGWQSGGTRRVPISLVVSFLVASNPAGYVSVSGARASLSGAGAVSYDPASGTVKLSTIAQGTVLGNPAIGAVAPPSAQTIPQILGYTPTQQGSGVGQDPSVIVKLGASSSNGMQLKLTMGTTDVGSVVLSPTDAVSVATFLTRVEALSAGNYDKLMVSLPTDTPALTIKLKHSLNVQQSDTALKAFVQSALGINDSQWAGLFA